jgi:hypothetical protein
MSGKVDPTETNDPSHGADLFGSLNALREKTRAVWSTAHDAFWVLSRPGSHGQSSLSRPGRGVG